jgi:PAS domain S-box-containing protein
MMEFLTKLFDSSDFIPRRGWTPELVWFHLITDVLIGLAYLAIPVVLVYFVRRRRDVQFNWMFLLFGAFILASGFTHFMEALAPFAPLYRLSGVVKLLTALVSWATVICFIPLIPKALALRSPAALEALDLELQREVTVRKRAEEDLRKMHVESEQRVHLQTAELSMANADLRKEIVERKRAEGRFQAIVEAAPNAMVMVNQKGSITLVNSQAEVLFGYSRQELIGQPVVTLVPERLRCPHPERRRSFFAGPQTRAMGVGRDLYGRRRDGSEFPVEIGLNPIETAEGPMVLSAIVDITERKRAEEHVLASLHEKEVLLKEIHHRVKNNLAVISSLFYLQSTYAHDDRAVQMFRDSQDRVRSMALVHESLYRSENLAEVDFGEYARSLAANLFRSYSLPQNNIHLKTDIQQVTLSIETAVPCGLILNELISNCLKHAFPSSRQGEIRLDLRVEAEGRCLLKVSDDGIGMPAGLDVMSTRSLGLRLVRSLTGQIDGDIEFHNDHPGTEAQLSFPMKNGHERR